MSRGTLYRHADADVDWVPERFGKISPSQANLVTTVRGKNNVSTVLVATSHDTSATLISRSFFGGYP